MGKQLVAGVSVLLLLAIVMTSRDAFTKGTFAVTIADYNSAQVAQNGYIVTVPYGFTVGGTSFSAVYTVTNGTMLQAGSRFTITLPAGFTFNSQPTLSIASGGASYFSGGIGSQTTTFQITSNTIGTVEIDEFAMATPSSFASQFGGSTLAMSAQATNNASTVNDDPSPVSQPAFTHAVGSLPSTNIPGGGQINLAFPYYGNQFVPGGIDGKTIQAAGSVANFSVVTETNDPFNQNAVVLSPSGGLNSLALADNATITVTGYFNGIGSAYASSVGTCQATIPAGALAGTVTNTSISFSPVRINSQIQICIIPNGVMWDNTMPYVFTYEAAPGVTDFFGGLSQTTAGNFFTYSPAPTVVILAGTPQHAAINTAFAAPLSVKVYDSTSNPIKYLDGINVIFTAPPYYLNGASGDFMGGGSTISVATDVNGIATTPKFDANAITCSYPVIANVGASKVGFVLTNEPSAANDIIFCYGFDE